MITGTNHFISERAAGRYYRDYWPSATPDELRTWIAHKLEAGEIAIGRPDAPRGARVFVIRGEGRYAIED